MLASDCEKLRQNKNKNPRLQMLDKNLMVTHKVMIKALN